MPSLLFPEFDQLATGVALLRADEGIAYANPALASWLGVSPRRLCTFRFGELLAAPAALARARERLPAEDQAVDLRQQQLIRPDGETTFADLEISPWTLADGDGHAAAPGMLLVEVHPVAEFPGTEWPRAMNAALRGLAHEVKNPLAGVRGAAQLLGRRLNGGDGRELLDVIVAEVDRLTALVDRLLEPGAPAAPGQVNIHEVLERVRLLAEAEAGWAVAIVRDYDPSLPPLSGSADRLTQALLNLVRNALQAGGSEVRLRTRADHNVPLNERMVRLALRIEIDDNGRGVPEDLASRIFLPLVTSRAEGSGLGLPLALDVAREHGGSLSFRSRPGHTVFTLLLPVTEGAP
jgi:two-component system nitrogen regulation sensor histidine kinase GlnL